MPEMITVTTDGDVREITLARPDRLNAINQVMIAELHQAFDAAASARAVLLCGAGRAFSAGRDLAEASPATEDAAAVLREQVGPLLSHLYELPMPTIAAVQGACLGAGLGLAFACDMVVVAEDAMIASPFGRLGAVLDSGGHHHFARLIGRHRALELIYTGRRLTGAEAAAWGLVNRAVPLADLLTETRTLAQQIAAGPTAAFRISKRIIREGDQAGFRAALAAEADAQGEASRTRDYQAGMAAFREKRQPIFEGR